MKDSRKILASGESPGRQVASRNDLTREGSFRFNSPLPKHLLLAILGGVAESRGGKGSRIKGEGLFF